MRVRTSTNLYVVLTSEYPSLVAAATAAAAGEEKIDILRCHLAAGANVDPSLEQGEYREALEAAQGLQDSDDSDADMVVQS
ncbi:hypothetical protein N7541_001145 [Penicillium brevicompactum]|uniref:Uncharacterized protein n=1 Tax=Penicillium brevicompactum TaxID=5074 RepID=A0A9W9RY60_PENBR|nr:hypothetical protein N7541_001145 [Penicillium brevicompactum]